jgi:hypothetical protein
LAKYKRKGVARKQRNQPIAAKGIRAPPRYWKQKETNHQPGNFVYPFIE